MEEARPPQRNSSPCSWGAAAFLVLLAACQKPEGASRGEAFFKSLNCQACHRIGKEGSSGGTDLSFAGFARSKEWLELWLRDPQAWKKDALMPNFRLSPGSRQALVEYLATLKGHAYRKGRAPWDEPRLSSDPVRRGLVIYQRAGCSGCHGRAGKGGYPNNNVPGSLIAALDRVAEGYTKPELKERIRKGVKPQKQDPSGPEPMLSMPAWGEVLKEDELDSLVEYLFSLKAALPEKEKW